MSLRIGFDMDGVLADFAAAYRLVEQRLFGTDGPPEIEKPEEPAAKEEREAAGVDGPGRRDSVWAAIRETPDFWETLAPLRPAAVARIQDLSLRHRWEVFFVTQRPATDGDTVQRQTQRWLVKQGFELPSVLVIKGPRGAAAGALRLDYHVDDSPANCIDVKSASAAKTILVVEDSDLLNIASARRLGIATVPHIDVALDILEQASAAATRPGILKQLASLVGWS
jgi:FMN phosphatase YigB (HAD superfamily)